MIDIRNVFADGLAVTGTARRHAKPAFSRWISLMSITLFSPHLRSPLNFIPVGQNAISGDKLRKAVGQLGGSHR